MPKLKIKKGDKVVVITGRDKGKTGEVKKVLPAENRVVVDGINMVKRHTSPSAGNAGASSRKKPRSTSRTSPTSIPRPISRRASATRRSRTAGRSALPSGPARSSTPEARSHDDSSQRALRHGG